MDAASSCVIVQLLGGHLVHHSSIAIVGSPTCLIVADPRHAAALSVNEMYSKTLNVQQEVPSLFSSTLWPSLICHSAAKEAHECRRRCSVIPCFVV
eukprot:1457773-Amphidinium_carterae.1